MKGERAYHVKSEIDPAAGVLDKEGLYWAKDLAEAVALFIRENFKFADGAELRDLELHKIKAERR